MLQPRVFLAVLVSCLPAWGGSTQILSSPYPSVLPREEVEKRADTLLAELTLEEKISLLAGDGQDGMSTVEIARLGIPKLVMADGPQGIRAHGPALSFPSGIALAATWDPSLAFRYGEALGREARARGIHIQLGPGVNIARTPLNGRNFEYFGEDPFLSGEIAADWIRGLQSKGVAATVKHFVGNDAEWRRMEIDSVIDEQTLREIYLPPFRKALQKGGAWSVMSAYNKLNGIPSTSNDALQNKVLRGEWGFPGPVMSDWWATESVDSLAKGLDLEMPMAYRITPENAYKALFEKQITPEQIDRAVRRLLVMSLSMGFHDRPQLQKNLPLDSRENAAVALGVATKSIVLLKNKPALLPLDKSRLKRVVVYGPNGQDTPAVGGGSGGVIPFRKVSFLEGVRNALPKDVDVLYVPMPLAARFSFFKFFDFPSRSPAVPKIINIRKMVAVTDNKLTRITTSRQKQIQLSWSRKVRPEGVPKDREARVLWNAEIEAPESGTYELLSQGHPEIRLGNRELGTPESYVLNLEKGIRLPLRVTANEVGRGYGSVSLNIIPISESDTGMTPAKGADAAIVCVGLNPDVEGEGYDRGFSLPRSQQHLISEVSAANPRTVVVLSGGGAVDMLPWIDSVPAVLQTWYLGQYAGTALASILFGDANPSGHLPCTFDRSIDENPSQAHYPGIFPEGRDAPVVTYQEGIFYGYRGYDRSGFAPLFPFGHGLSYTDFQLADLKVIPVTDGFCASLRISNEGARTGATVAQLYVGLGGESSPRPVRELKGFQRVELKPGESRVITIPLPWTTLAYWSPISRSWVTPEGAIRIEAGLSERDIRDVVMLPGLTYRPGTPSP